MSTEYCPECGHVIPVEVGFGCTCTHCNWSGLVASTDPRRDTRNDGPTPPPTLTSVEAQERARVLGRIRVGGW